MVAAGEDTVFGRTDNLLAFEEGPFYAVYTVPYLMMTAADRASTATPSSCVRTARW